jgi:hypothetical protein
MLQALALAPVIRTYPTKLGLDIVIPDDLPSPAPQAQLGHACQCQLPQVALLHTTGDQGHGDVSLDAVDAHPGRHQRQDAAASSSSSSSSGRI